MKPNVKVVDIGFGTGFPLIELSQRFGETCSIFGIDIWPQGIKKAKEKINVLGLKNIQIIEQSASSLPFDANQIDLITSNLGINNFEEKEKVIKECHRVLKRGGSISITTNPIGTFNEIFNLFELIFDKMGLHKSSIQLETYLKSRSTKEATIDLFKQHGLSCIKSKERNAIIRFANATAVLDHSLIRIGFIEGWESLIPIEHRDTFFKELENQIQQIIDQNNEFVLSIPILYLEFIKKQLNA